MIIARRSRAIIFFFGLKLVKIISPRANNNKIISPWANNNKILKPSGRWPSGFRILLLLALGLIILLLLALGLIIFSSLRPKKELLALRDNNFIISQIILYCEVKSSPLGIFIYKPFTCIELIIKPVWLFVVTGQCAGMQPDS